MKKGYTHITIILDRSGSMASIQDEVIQGFNSFLQDQKAVKGTATLTLVQFDSFDAYEVIHNFKPIDRIQELSSDTYKPRAGTPLMDSMGRGIRETDYSIKKCLTKDQPSKIIFVVISDGKDNDSCCFHKMKLCKLLAEKMYQQGWQFVYLSADLEAIQDAYEYGIPSDSTQFFSHTPSGTTSVWQSLSTRVTDYRTNVSDSMTFDNNDR